MQLLNSLTGWFLNREPKELPALASAELTGRIL